MQPAVAMKAHAVAALMPEMSERDFATLKEDISKHGVRVPILVYHSQILDGRHRYRACQELGIPCPTLKWNGRDPWLEAQSRNLVRRHLTKDQVYAIRKLAAERYPELAAPIQAVKDAAKKRQIRRAHTKARSGAEPDLSGSHDPHRLVSADLIGAQMGISGATVKRVDRLAREGPELLPRVAAGEMSVMKALRQVSLERHGLLSPSMADAERYDVESTVLHLERTIKRNWTKCPIRFRMVFLRALRDIFRELVAESSSRSEADTGDVRPRHTGASLRAVQRPDYVGSGAQQFRGPS
jgi:hypothetical protein